MHAVRHRIDEQLKGDGWPVSVSRHLRDNGGQIAAGAIADNS